MTKTVIDPLDWGTIVDSIRAGRCVPFLGAGVNVSVTGGYDGLRVGSQVSEYLLGKLLGKDGAALDELISVIPDPAVKATLEDDYADLVTPRARDLARVALHIQTRPGGRNRLLELLAETLPDESKEPSPLLTDARTPPAPPDRDHELRPAVGESLTRRDEGGTGRDRAADERVQRKAAARLAATTRSTRSRQPVATRTNEPVIVYKIHGTFGDDESGLVISEEDYIEFLSVAGPESERSMPRLIRQLIVDSNLLFLGYALEDWNFRALYKGLVEQLPPHKQRSSFAIQRKPSKFWADFWAKPPKNVTIYDVDLYEFGDDLRNKANV